MLSRELGDAANGQWRVSGCEYLIVTPSTRKQTVEQASRMPWLIVFWLGESIVSLGRLDRQTNNPLQRVRTVSLKMG